MPLSDENLVKMIITDKSELPQFPESTLLVTLDGSKMRTLRAFYPRIAKALFFPDHFGKNLDALFDCLCDLEAVDAKCTTVVLIIDHAATLFTKEKDKKKEAALRVLQDACAAENRYDNRTFQLFYC